MPKNDVCGFFEPVQIGPPAQDGLVDIMPYHPDILYFGRIDCSNKYAPSFAHSGISIRMRFEGDSIDVRLRDFGNGEMPVYYNVIIDNNEPFLLETLPGDHEYVLARNLSEGEHSVELFKRVESCLGGYTNAGKGAFLGFRIKANKKVLPPIFKPYRIEFIGDSITCGYGNEISTMTPEYFQFTSENENAYNAWGAVAARMLNAEYMSVAYSGRGIYRNWADDPGLTIPEIYDLVLPDEANSPIWNVSRYIPDITVINLGTNDMSEGAKDIADIKRHYKNAFEDFLTVLRSHYPQTAFIIAVGPMLSDIYPDGYNALTDTIAALTTIIELRKQTGDDLLYLLQLEEQSPPWGEDWHPTTSVHYRMAEELVHFIDDNDILSKVKGSLSNGDF